MVAVEGAATIPSDGGVAPPLTSSARSDWIRSCFRHGRRFKRSTEARGPSKRLRRWRSECGGACWACRPAT